MAEPESFAERQIKPVGGLTAVAIGVTAILTIAVVAIIVDSSVAATIAGSAAAAIGSIVGAFFGVKIGTDQTKAAAEGEREEAARAGGAAPVGGSLGTPVPVAPSAGSGS